MIRSFKILAVLLGGLIFCSCLEAQALDIQPSSLTEKFELLDKHISVKMPKGSKAEPRGHSIMGAPEADEDESRIEFSMDEKKFVLMAYDLHATKGADFKASVDAYLKLQDEQCKRCSEILKSANGVEYVLVKRKKKNIDPDDEANLVESAIVVNSDNSTQQLDFYVNNVGAKEWDNALSFAEAVFQTVSVDSSSANYKKRNIKIDEFLGLSIEIPDNTSTSMQFGCDFKVFHCNLIKPLGQPSAGLGIYVGHHPDKPKKNNKQLKKSSILGQSVEWQRSTSESSSMKSETLMNLKEYPICFLHFFASAKSEKELEELEKISESLTLDKTAPAYQPTQKGYLEMMMSDPKNAIEQFKLALEKDPKDIKAYAGIAQAYLSLKDNGKAIEAYTQALKVDTKPEILLERSWIFQEIGKKDQALEDLNQCISIDSNNAEAYYQRGKILNDDKKFKEALTDFSKYLETFPDVPDVRIERAKVYRALGEYQKAVDDCTFIIEDRKTKEAFEERALNYEKLGKNDLAKDDRAKASELD